jgi:hypothetical protein
LEHSFVGAGTCNILGEVNKKYLERELSCSGLLRSEKWQFLTDVSGQPIRFIFRGKELMGCSRIVVQKLPLRAA